MAKIENPAEAPSPVRPPRPAPRAQGSRGAGSPGAVSAGLDGLARVAKSKDERALGARAGTVDEVVPDVGARATADEEQAPATERDTPLPGGNTGQADAGAHADGAQVDGAHAAGLGTLGARDEGASAPAAAAGHARARGLAALPLANLEMPSSARLELTPSPVPRVALAPATGSVDISLVPGPHASRHLPTLAAQHILGRRQARRAAPALTLPPPSRAVHEPRRVAELAKDVRSSKREIVLGLSIGLGLSLVLAAIGQSYLRLDMVADTPAELESLTLSARPLDTAAGAPVRDARGGEAAAVSRTEPPPSEPSEPAGSEASSARTEPTGPAAVDARASAEAAAPREAAPAPAPRSAAAAGRRLAVALPEKPSGARRPAERAYRRAAGSGGPGSSAGARGVLASDAAPFEPSPPADATPDHEPLSPAESAGLGLDLPL